jgi:hypothetical protein
VSSMATDLGVMGGGRRYVSPDERSL